MLLFVRGFGDLLLLSSVALAPSLVRSPGAAVAAVVARCVLPWRRSCATAGAFWLPGLCRRCSAIWRMFVCLLHVPPVHSAVSWPRAGPGLSVSLLRLCSRSCASCSPSDRGSFVIGQVTVPAFLSVAAGVSDGLLRPRSCPSRCQPMRYLVGCRLVDWRSHFQPLFDQFAPCWGRDSQSIRRELTYEHHNRRSCRPGDSCPERRSSQLS